MSDEPLPKYVDQNYARTCSLDLSSWLLDNSLPAICEPRHNGIRVFFFKSREHFVITGRLGNLFTPAGNPAVFSKIPRLRNAPERVILDGEYVARDGLHLFDVLQIDDRDLRPLPLYRRKEFLHQIIGGSGLETPFIMADSQEEIRRYSDDMFSKGFDAVMIKNYNSFYGEPNSWGRIKKFDTLDCFVIDLRDKPVRSWTIGVYDSSGKIVNLGEIASVLERVDPRKVRLGSVVEVRFEIVDGKFGGQFVTRVRRDKLASECLLCQIPQLEKTILP